MKIILQLVHSEHHNLVILNALAQHNAAMLLERPGLPLLYDVGVVYRREDVETWSDVIWTYKQGHEDCDALSAARAGELIARGGAALRRGDPGWERGQRLPTIHAEVMLETRAPVNGPGVYHCITRYQLTPAGRPRHDLPWYIDDPSLRLGMRDGMVDKAVLRRWRAAGVTPGTPYNVEK